MHSNKLALRVILNSYMIYMSVQKGQTKILPPIEDSFVLIIC